MDVADTLAVLVSLTVCLGVTFPTFGMAFDSSFMAFAPAACVTQPSFDRDRLSDLKQDQTTVCTDAAFEGQFCQQSS